MRFILIDKICSLNPGKDIACEQTFNASEELFLDHFPGFPVVPGVLLTETMAQAAGKCLMAESISGRGLPMLSKIMSAKFNVWARPDQLLAVYATIESSQNKFATVKAHITAASKRICSARLMFSFMDDQVFAKGYKDPVLTMFYANSDSSSSSDAY